MTEQRVYYEWAVEEVTTIETEEHEENEVLDVHHFDTFREAKRCSTMPISEGMRWDVVLIRDDLHTRSWAYMEDGKLPLHFEDAYQNATAKVPQRFHNEVTRA